MASKMICPECGAVFVKASQKTKKRRGVLEALFGSGGHYESSHRQEFGHAVTPPLPWMRQPHQQEPPTGAGETVWRQLGLRDVGMPMLMGAAGVGVPVVASTIAVGLFILWPPSLWASAPLMVTAIGATIIFWKMNMPHFRHADDDTGEAMLRTRERVPDAAAPAEQEPAKQPERMVRVAVQSEPGHDNRMDFLDHPKMYKFAHAVLSGAPFTAETAKKYLGYSRAKWEKFRDEFMSKPGWAMWKNPKHHQDGIDILPLGRAALRGSLPRSGVGEV